MKIEQIKEVEENLEDVKGKRVNWQADTEDITADKNIKALF